MGGPTGTAPGGGNDMNRRVTPILRRIVAGLGPEPVALRHAGRIMRRSVTGDPEGGRGDPTKQVSLDMTRGFQREIEQRLRVIHDDVANASLLDIPKHLTNAYVYLLNHRAFVDPQVWEQQLELVQKAHDWVISIGRMKEADFRAYAYAASDGGDDQLPPLGELKKLVERGGEGSGNFEHAGRPGEVGGSAPGTGMPTTHEGAVAEFSKGMRPIRSVLLSLPDDLGAQRTDAVAGLTWKVGENPITPYLGHSDVRGALKAQIVRNLAWAVTNPKLSEYPDYREEFARGDTASEIVADHLVENWAQTSNDTDMRALSIQEQISREFDAPMSPWQSAKLDEAASRVTAPGAPSRPDEAGSTFSQWMTGQVNQKMDLAPALGPDVARLTVPDVEGAVHDMLGKMYSDTQNLYALAGVQDVTVYRGVLSDSVPKDLYAAVQRGERVDVRLTDQNAAESWSLNPQTAWEFADEGKGVVLEAKVPVTHLLSTCATGFGCLPEGEVIVLNKGDLPARAMSNLGDFFAPGYTPGGREAAT